MWQIFIQPLIEFVLPLYKWERAKKNIQKADSIIRSSFKLFTGLKINTSNEVVDLLSGYNFRQRADLMYQVSSQKWLCRRNGIMHKFEFLPYSIRQPLNTNKINLCKCMPHELIDYLNTSKSLCAKCGVPNSFNHLKYVHNCPLPDLTEILKLSKMYQMAKVPRKQSLEVIRSVIKGFLSKMQECIQIQKNLVIKLIS